MLTRAPTRIDLGGGWTDVPPYSEREGGFVCNIAITRYSIAALRASDSSDYKSDESALARAAVRRSGITNIAVRLETDVPMGAGLGGSSSASAALLGALAQWNGDAIDRVAIAEAGRRIEVEDLGIPGGRQDHYAATHGGALGLTFGRAVGVRRIPFTAAAREEMLASATLIYTGQSRISGDTITAVMSAYEAGEARVVTALERMRALACDMADAVAAADIYALGELLDEHWSYQRSLHHSIPTPRIDEIVARARRAGAIGAKAMGASGGGCVLILSRPATTDAVRAAVAPLGDLLPFGFDESGLTIVRDVA